MTKQAKNGVAKQILVQFQAALEASSSRNNVTDIEDAMKKAAVRYDTSGTRGR